MGGKGKGFTGTIIKDTWTITRGGGNGGGRRCRLGWWGGVGERQKTVLEQQQTNKQFIYRIAHQDPGNID